MRAILRTRFGGPEVLVIREIPEPEPKEGHVVIQVKAFGLNHAELHMRRGEWAEIADISGIAGGSFTNIVSFRIELFKSG
jgi:NADPH:quinone reductase-like Zn-dependent oxidoreductase